MKDYLLLALLAMIFAIMSGLFGAIVGAAGAAFGDRAGGSLVIGLCIAAIIFSVIGFLFAFVGLRNPKFFGFLLIIIGIMQLILMSLFGVLPMILFITSGVMLRKERKHYSNS
jgi:uncharacterized membrane protein